jgi:integrase
LLAFVPGVRHIRAVRTVQGLISLLPQRYPGAIMSLTELTARKLKAPAKGRRRERYDRLIPGFGIRITDRGVRSYIFMYTFRGRRRRYTIGRIDEIGIEDARERARELRAQVRREGRDPCAELKAQRGLERTATFADVVDIYDKRVLAGQRSAHPTRLTVAKYLLPHWRDLPVASISRAHVLERIEAVADAGLPVAARRLFEITRRIMNWAIARGTFGIEHSPCEKLRPSDIVGKKRSRDRILSDREWRALFRAASTLGYPTEPFISLLALTALRRSEVGEARWAEIDLAKSEWVIPAARMKGDAPHVVPLTKQMVGVLESLPRTSEYLFPARSGRPISGFSDIKRQLDREMLVALREEDPEAELAGWSFHDLRRSIRTALSSLPVPGGDLVRELVLAHAKPELHATYDLHLYLSEKRRALELWTEKLRSILEERSADVVQLAQRA